MTDTRPIQPAPVVKLSHEEIRMTYCLEEWHRAAAKIARKSGRYDDADRHDAKADGLLWRRMTGLDAGRSLLAQTEGAR